MRHNPKSKRWRGISIDHLNEPPATLARLNTLIGDARQQGLPFEYLKVMQAEIAPHSLVKFSREELARFYARLQGWMTWAKAHLQIQEFVAFANGEPEPRTVQRKQQPQPDGENHMAIEMTIRAHFEHEKDWLSFCGKLSVLGFMKGEHAEHGKHGDKLIGRAHGEHEHAHHGGKHSGEQNVNALEHDHEEETEPKPRKSRAKTEKGNAKTEYTQKDVSAVVDRAKKEAGMTNLQIGKVIKSCGADGFANLPQEKYGELIAKLEDEISASKSDVLL